MGWRGTAVLAVLVIVIGAYLWSEGAPPGGFGRPALVGEAPPREPTKPVQHLLQFSPSEVTDIQLEQEGRTRETRRVGDRWRGTEGGDVIDDFLHDLANLGVLADIPAGSGELEQYGLQPPAGVVRLRVQGGATPLVLQLGDHNRPTTGVYARIGDDGPVVLAGSLLAWQFDRAFKALAVPGVER